MVSSSKRLPTTVDALVTNRRIGNDLYGLNRLRNTTRTIQPPPRSGAPSQGSSGSSSGTGLKTVGDSMIGPIAFFPVDASMTNDSIDISASGNSPSDFSSNVKLLPEGGVDDDLLTIFGAAFDGQLLYLQGAANLTVTIIEGTAGNGGNILTNGETLSISGGQIITLLFDMSADTGDAAVNGAWRVVAGGTVEGEAVAILGRDVDQVLNGVAVDSIINYDDNFFFGDTAKITDQTGGVFKLLAGSVYSASSINSFFLDSTGNGTDVVGVWEVSLDNVPANFVAVLAGVLAEESQILCVASIGKPNVTVQPNAQAFIINASAQDVFIRFNVTVQSTQGSPNSWLNAASGAVIETIGEGGGSGGGGGTQGTLGGLSDVELTDIMTNDHLVFDGNEWTNQSASQASQTPWTSNIDGDGYNLDFNQNVTRPAPAITNLKSIQMGIWNGSVFPKGTINVEPDRFELNITESVDDFFIKSNSDPILQYDASQTRWKTFVDFSMSSHILREVRDITFAGVKVSPTAITPEIYYAEDATHEEFVYNAKAGGEHHFLSGGDNNVPILELGFVTIDDVTYGNIRNVMRIELPSASVAIPGNSDGDIQSVFNGVTSDVFIWSGGAARNCSLIGTGGGNTDRIISPDTNTNVITNDGSVTTQVEGMIRSTLSDTVYTIGVPLNLGSQGIQSVNFITPDSTTAIIGNNSNFWEFVYTQNVIFGNINNSIFGDNGGLDFDVGSGNNFKFSALNQLFQIGPNSCQITNGNLEMNAQRITNIPLVPSADGDAASKKYVDDNAGGTLDGTIEAALWTDGETDQFDFFVYHSNSNNNGNKDSSSLIEDIVFYVPLFIGKEVDLFRMAVGVQSAGGGAYNLAFGVYSNRTDGQNYPDTLVAQANGLHAGAGVQFQQMGAQTLSPGLYWLAVLCVTNSSQVVDSYGDGDCHSVGWFRDTNAFEPITGYLSSQTGTTLPTNPPDEMPTILSSAAVTPAVYVRFT